MSKLVSFIIPVYHNEGTLTIISSQITNLMTKELPQLDFEIIFINDGSTDGSWDELKSVNANNKHVKIISFSRNFGQIPGIICGWKEAKGDAVINMSADLQDPVEQAIEMIKNWLAGDEIVISYRIARNDSFFTNLTSKIFYALMKNNVPKMPLGGFDFALLDRKAVNAVNQLNERNRVYQYDVLWLGFKLKFLPYERLVREIGKSQWGFKKRFNYFILSYLYVSYFPIRLMSGIGLITSFTGFIYALIVFFNYFVNKAPFNGWTPLMIVLLIIGGGTMLMLGIIGEYIWRIYDELKNKPHYIIDEKIENNLH